MSRSVLVVGAGIAGLAAAWEAARGGAAVTVVSDLPGASALSAGAVDDLPWELVLRAAGTLGVAPGARPITPDIAEFARALGLWDLPARALPWLATAAGRIRPARGHDRALLDLSAIEDTEVLLPRVDRAGWDADAIATSLTDDPFARRKRLRFVAIDVPILRFEGEQRIADGELAARHDDDARLGWLAERLREGLSRRGRGGAVLLGPWLGARAPRAEALAKAVGVPIGEVLVGAGTSAGLRFEAARDRLLRTIGAQVVRGRVTRVDGRAGALAVTLAQGQEPVAASAVVLAIGGLVGGGVVYAPPDHEAGMDLPPGGRVPFALSVRADVTLAGSSAPTRTALGARRMGVTSSLHGPELDLTAWPSDGRPGALESAGVRCEGARAAPGITAAGDVIAGRRRTVLEAVASGLSAGKAHAAELRSDEAAFTIEREA